MKKILIASAVTLATATGAFAADMAARAPVYTKAPPSPAAYSWTGFYVGGTAGGAWGTFDPTTTTTFTNPIISYFAPSSIPIFNSAAAQQIKPAGFTGGFEAGYNWQTSNFVLGLEGDIESFHLSGTSTSGFVRYAGFGAAGLTVNSNSSTDWLATARGRLGYAADKWLFFVTGGAAFTNLKSSFTFADTFLTGAAASGSVSATKTGYAVGGGVEAGLWGNWSVKAEYLYVNFGSVSAVSNNLVFGGAPFPGQVFTHSVDLKANIARLGLNYRL
jgi:outer membrane immunogenic protein